MNNDRGTFTLSLDCEGLWGMADSSSVIKSGVITTRALEGTYDSILSCLDRTGLRATTAFVSAFAAPPDATRECLPLLVELKKLNPAWFAEIEWRVRAADPTSLDGWQGHAFWLRAAAAGHELAWHGATHMPLHASANPEAVDLEIQVAQQLCAAMGNQPASIVFPRNQSGHFDKLKRLHAPIYRKASGVSRLTAFAREWNVFDRGVSDRPEFVDDWCALPAGFFLNWPSGAKSVIPLRATVARWRSMLRHAVRHRRQVHMWFHPHNLLTAPPMRHVFEQLMQDVSDLVRSGDLRNLTMSELAEDAATGKRS